MWTPDVDTGNEPIHFDLFHCCALVAFVEQARAQEGWPDCEATRRRAFSLYEQELRKKNAAKPPAARAPDRKACA